MITKDQFDSYERIRVLGIVNMFDVPQVMKLAKLTRVEVLTIMKRYEAIRGEYYPPLPAAPEPEPEPIETDVCMKCGGEFPETEMNRFDRLGDSICFACTAKRNRAPLRYGWRRIALRGDE